MLRRGIIPKLRLLSVPVAWMASNAWLQLALQPFCVANTLNAACVWLVHGAVVPWNPLSIETQRNAICIRNSWLTRLEDSRFGNLPRGSPGGSPAGSGRQSDIENQISLPRSQ